MIYDSLICYIIVIPTRLLCFEDLFMLKSSSFEPDEERPISIEENLDLQTCHNSEINTRHVQRGTLIDLFFFFFDIIKMIDFL